MHAGFDLRKPRRTERLPDAQAIYRMMRGGMTAKQVAAALNCQIGTVHSKLSAAGLSEKRVRVAPSDDVLINYFREGVRSVDISARSGLSLSVVRHHRQRLASRIVDVPPWVLAEHHDEYIRLAITKPNGEHDAAKWARQAKRAAVSA